MKTITPGSRSQDAMSIRVEVCTAQATCVLFQARALSCGRRSGLYRPGALPAAVEHGGAVGIARRECPDATFPICHIRSGPRGGPSCRRRNVTVTSRVAGAG
jgi:hypothetical protein